MVTMCVDRELDGHGLAGARVLAAVATLGALICLVLAPIQSAAWNASEPGPAPLAVSLLQVVVDAGARVHDAVGVRLGMRPYEFWGRQFVLVYLGAIAGVVLIGRFALGRAQRIGRRLLLIGLLVALAGDVAAYWSIGTALEDVLWSGGFGVELAGLLLTLIGALVLGGALLRAGRSPGVVLLTGAALAVPMTVVVRYIPHGTVLPLAVAIAAVSWLLIREGAGAVGVPARAGPA